VKRCSWATREPLLSYHDKEWGTPRHDERTLFEFLVLEGAQAGLSWETILRKRAAYRKAFARFAPKTVARYGARDVARLMADAGIVRNRAKITSAITNAKAFLAVAEEHGSFDSCHGIFESAVSGSLDRRSASRSWRPSAWSITTKRAVFGGPPAPEHPCRGLPVRWREPRICART